MKKYLNVLFKKENYEKITNYKNCPERKKWRYKRLLGKRSYIDHLTDNLAYGKCKKKYGRQRTVHKGTKEEPILIMFGAANFSTSMKNLSAIPRKNILKTLARKTLVFLTNEHNTSKCCCKCGKNLVNIINKQQKLINGTLHKKWESKDLRSVKLCINNDCTTNNYDFFAIDRDINASNNILVNGLETILKKTYWVVSIPKTYQAY